MRTTLTPESRRERRFRVREVFTRGDWPRWEVQPSGRASLGGVWWRLGTFEQMLPLAVVVVSGVELNFAEYRPREVAEDLDLLSCPVSGLVVDCA